MNNTTNYQNTFIAVAEDCPTEKGEVPPVKGSTKTAANIQFDMISKHPYRYDSDDVIFGVFAWKNDVSPGEIIEERNRFFSKGQPCLRSSPLAKRYGWGVHSNDVGKVAIYPLGSAEYKKLAGDQSLTQLKAMRSRKG